MKARKYRISERAAQDLAQENLTVGDIALVLTFGRREVCHMAQLISLSEGDVPTAKQNERKRLNGLTVVILGNCIVKVYRRDTTGGKQ